jgi:prephenate dehydrogenase
MGTSIAMACRRAGLVASGWDPDPVVAARSSERSGARSAPTLAEAVAGTELVVVCAPLDEVAGTVVEALAADDRAVVTDIGSVKRRIADDVGAHLGDEGGGSRFVPGHPMGGSERTGPEHASAHVVDGIVWALTPLAGTDPDAVAVVQRVVSAVGATPVVLDPDRHDRLVAFVSHLPQVASSTLMGLAAREEAGEPELLLLAAGGFRDLTRLAASSPELWSEILSANGAQVTAALDLYIRALESIRSRIAADDRPAISAAFATAKDARVRLAAKPQVRAGVAVFAVEIPDQPGALAGITGSISDAGVNIEDLQIVHSAEGGRGQVHLTVAGAAAAGASEVLTGAGYDPTRLA